ncbi:MAG: Phosphatidylinositol phosphate synthase @ Archaetidylinositol phosphate synthase [uncultured Corynebacteriales bacterium]|uniref:Phosphatidylinositol phosphate synthase n=1 Tax=uncultured Mycobacteriales bacterium TaxID=581187 RepID=A0A6J4J066_9ACTN|nr:MAG: Phosphatidylinositol phosphate synthase @ Archaetidylinositol phosphate synthase [uncultured Corynebacteriales bacterium]
MTGLFSRGLLSRAVWGRLAAPLVRVLVRLGVTANTVTVVGTLGSMAGALVLFGQGILFAGTLVIWGFVMLDMVDGAVARARGGSSVFGAVLDSSLDRLVDAAVFGALAWWFAGAGDDRSLQLAALLCLVLGVMVSYIKARAEGAGLSCDVGLVERPQRLSITLIGTGLSGIGVPYVLAVALWLLVALSAVTAVQRLVEVHRQAGGVARG